MDATFGYDLGDEIVAKAVTVKLSHALARALRDSDIECLFGVAGDANLYLIDAYVREVGGRYVSASNESGAVLMAAGYGSVSGGLGAATVTHGAITNTITALCDAAAGRQPLLLIAGDTAVVDKPNLQNLPHRDLVLPTGTGFEQVRSPETALADLAVGLRRAATERRPIVLNVPVDFQGAEVAYEPVRAHPPVVAGIAPAEPAMEEAAAVVAAAKRPVILAGRGATTPAARAALLRLATRIGAPVATTLRAKDLFRGEPYDIGVFGSLGTAEGLDVIARSDTIIAFGAGLNSRTTDRGALLRGRRVVQCDVDPLALGALSDVDVTVVGDTVEVAERLVALLDEADVPPTGFASPEMAARLAAADPSGWPARPGDRAPGTVDLRAALRAVDEAVPDDRTLTIDGGRFFFEAACRTPVQRPGDYVHTMNIASIGLGMGMAIGAACAAPERPALLIVGDGGFMLGGLAEFSTAVRHDADLIVVLLNDSAYGAEHVQFRDKGMDPGLSLFDWPDFAPVARALGGEGYTVRGPADLDGLADVVKRRERPLLVDVKLDPDRVPMPGAYHG